MFFHAVNGALVFLSVCVLFGYLTRTASVLFSAGFIFLRGWEYSFGKINHDFIVLLIPLLCAAAGWGNSYSVDARLKQEPRPSAKGAPVALYALVVGIMMLSAAVPKVLSGWLNPKTQAVLTKLVISHLVDRKATWFSQAALGIRSDWFWKSLDWFTCALEIGFICVFFRRSRLRVVCAIATFFHLGIALLMKIYFWYNILAYGAFADWDEMTTFFPYSFVHKLAAAVSKPNRIWVLTFAALLSAIYSIWGNPLMNLIGKTLEEAETRIGLCVIAMGCATSLVFFIRRLRSVGALSRKVGLVTADRQDVS